MCISLGRLVVYEAGNKRFSYFSLEGAFLKIEKPPLKGRIEGMQALDDGRIIVESTDVGGSEAKQEIYDLRILELYSSEMKHLKTLCRQTEHQFKYFKDMKPFPRLRIPYSPLLSWAVLPGGKLVLGYSEKYEFRIMDIDSGQTKVISRDFSPQKVTEADKKAHFDNFMSGEPGKAKLGADKEIKDNTEFPGIKPAFKQICTDTDGNILVFPYTPVDHGKIGWDVYSFDVFDAKGDYVNSVKITDGKSFKYGKVISVPGNGLWCRELDDDLDLIWVKYEVR